MLRLPAEWAPQSGVMLTWPHAASDWAPRLAEVEPVFVAIAREVGRREHVLVSCRDAAHRAHVADLLADAVPAERLHLHIAPSNDTWVRDHGPITVLDGTHPTLLDFTFNGWGRKYEARLDNALTGVLHAQGAFGDHALRAVDLVLEGGSIEVDGAGTLLTTTRCLLSPMRNPALGCQALEAQFGELMGIERVLWLEHGYLVGDDTDSHIDTLARFCDSDTIAYVRCDDPADEHYTELQAMEAELQALRRADGSPYRLVPLPWPGAKHDERGERLPATYANFLIINGAVLVPTYRDAADAEALARLAECFPEREVVGIDCLPLIHQFGSLHCVTMQVPAGVLGGGEDG
ncbi:agmatine deiminase family protein [Ectothiorhodospiraceae bacterium 2226]|nr:agmatine deiminase family protein [Ectothiorhodospiraceae bacterium 2226]